MTISRCIYLLLLTVTLTVGEGIIEEEPVVEEKYSKPSAIDEKGPLIDESAAKTSSSASSTSSDKTPSGWSSSSTSSCLSYPSCNSPDQNCCKCNQNFSKCCTDYFASTPEGYCHYDTCKPCKSSGSYCISSSQCCNSQNTNSQNVSTCMNNVCCVAPSSAGCSKDADCCQPLQTNSNSGYQCSSNYCTPCKNNGQSCAAGSECCGKTTCGNTLDKRNHIDRFGICCVAPGDECRIGQDLCCDTGGCEKSVHSSKRYKCTEKSSSKSLPSEESLEGDVKGGSHGWGSGGNNAAGWNQHHGGGWPGNNDGGWGWGHDSTSGWSSGSSAGWSSNVIEQVPQKYTLGVCQECVPNGPCGSSSDCCTGYMCQLGQCVEISGNILRLRPESCKDEA